MSVNRLLIVANRLPVNARVDGEGIRLTRASAGLATGLRGLHAAAGSLWIGWPGDTTIFSASQHRALDIAMAKHGAVAVNLSADDVERYYEGFSNRVRRPARGPRDSGTAPRDGKRTSRSTSSSPTR